MKKKHMDVGMDIHKEDNVIALAEGRSPGHLQATHCPCGSSKTIGLDTHTLKHGDEKVWERIVFLPIKGKMLAVLESTTGKQHRHVVGGMFVRVTKVAAVHHQRVVQQAAVALFDFLQVTQQAAKQFHVLVVDGIELG